MSNLITINKEDYIPIENIPNGNCLFYSLAFFDVGNDKRKIEERAKDKTYAIYTIVFIII